VLVPNFFADLTARKFCVSGYDLFYVTARYMLVLSLCDCTAD